jgi:catechol 2,3-dioxygenase-like lactoylglutathione lyase family enzyme
MSDLGLTHVAFLVKDIEKSIAFYGKYAGMKVVHRRGDEKSKVAWIGDHTRPFVIVLVQAKDAPDEAALGPFGHLGVAVASRAEVDRFAEEAKHEGILARPPTDSGPPVGYWTFISDPDGNMLELSFGQEVALTENSARERR